MICGLFSQVGLCGAKLNLYNPAGYAIFFGFCEDDSENRSNSACVRVHFSFVVRQKKENRARVYFVFFHLVCRPDYTIYFAGSYIFLKIFPDGLHIY